MVRRQYIRKTVKDLERTGLQNESGKRDDPCEDEVEKRLDQGKMGNTPKITTLKSLT